MFGLTSTKFEEISDKIDLIIHNGAYVHWLQPYSMLQVIFFSKIQI